MVDSALGCVNKLTPWRGVLPFSGKKWQQLGKSTSNTLADTQGGKGSNSLGLSRPGQGPSGRTALPLPAVQPQANVPVHLMESGFFLCRMLMPETTLEGARRVLAQHLAYTKNTIRIGICITMPSIVRALKTAMSFSMIHVYTKAPISFIEGGRGRILIVMWNKYYFVPLNKQFLAQIQWYPWAPHRGLWWVQANSLEHCIHQWVGNPYCFNPACKGGILQKHPAEFLQTSQETQVGEPG